MKHNAKTGIAERKGFPFYLSSCKTAREDHQGNERSQNVDTGNRGEPRWVAQGGCW